MIIRQSLKTLFLCLMLLPCAANALKLPVYETARLKSTAGTGVGSILIDEASILNPAPLAFFNISSIYLQKNKISTEPTSSNYPQNTSDPDLWGVILSDAHGGLRGSISYQKQEHLYNSRKRYALAMATPLGGKSAMGVTYRYTKDRLSDDGQNFQDDDYTQMVLGFSHVLTNEFTMGIIFIDPLKRKQEDTLAQVGFQYEYKGFIILMLDAGADYNDDLSKSILYKTAIQFKLFRDFFIRAGTFYDKGKKQRGNGTGISWVQPRLMLELAFKNTTVLESTAKNQYGEKLKETAFAISYRF